MLDLDMEGLPLTFSEAVSFYRRRVGMTQEELAAMIGVSSGEIISRYERGEREPRLTTILALADALRVPLRALVPEEHDYGESGSWMNGVYRSLMILGEFTPAEAEMLTRLVESVATILPRLQGHSTFLRRVRRDLSGDLPQE